MRILADHPFLVGLSIRLIIMISLPILLDDGVLLQGVRYTDIDYDVFTDAADYVAAGRSPYERHTYRYTPFLAALLAWPIKAASSQSAAGIKWGGPLMWWTDKRYFGRLLFCLADALCGMIIIALRRKERRRNGEPTKSTTTKAEGCDKIREGYGHLQEQEYEHQPEHLLEALQQPNLVDALWWMYNPLAINICTRGSAESFVVILPVLLTLSILTRRDGNATSTSRARVIFRSIVAATTHGVAIHSKLYPVIYTVSFMAYISFQEHGNRWHDALPPRHGGKPSDSSSFPWLEPTRLLRLMYLWIRRLLLTPSSVLFLVISLSTFGGLTYLAVMEYGHEALEEGFLYHFSRVDHRHNYSMHWYWIYLARGRIARALASGTSVSASTTSSVAAMAWLGRILLLPQAILLLYVSLGVAPYDLSLALFVQTFLFVAHNKVITAQYFTWYLCLLPLCSGNVEWNTLRMKFSLAYLGAAVVTWLGSAFCLEMQGMPVHLLVWLASVNFFIANVNLLGAILSGYRATSRINAMSKKIQ